MMAIGVPTAQTSANGVARISIPGRYGSGPREVLRNALKNPDFVICARLRDVISLLVPGTLGTSEGLYPSVA
jgi:hypothetical protein